MDSISSDWNSFVTNPLAKITSLFDDLQQTDSSKTPSEQVYQFHHLLKQQVTDCVQNSIKLQSIPFLNGRNAFHDGLPNRSLIRYQCMVQDMFNPEVYTAAFRKTADDDAKQQQQNKNRVLNLYSDANLSEEHIDFYDGSNVILDRYVYYAISLPGVSNWVQECWSEQAGNERGTWTDDAADVQVASNSLKRSINEESTRKEVDDQLMEEDDESPGKKKRQSNEGLKDENVGQQDKNSATEGKEETKEEDAGFDSCFPIRAHEHLNRPCIVKIYDDQDMDVKLNDMIEVIGIIEFEEMEQVRAQQQQESKQDANQDLNGMMENLGIESDDYFRYPYSLVPRVHALSVKRLSQINPLPSFRLPNDEQQIAQLKSELHALFTQVLFGDTLAAEYLICWLLATVYVRKDVLAIGNFPLNLSRLPFGEKGDGGGDDQQFIRLLHELISNLCTHTHLLPLTIDTLNKTLFVPFRSKNGCKIKSGLLQLPSNLMLVIDETSLQPGQLKANGIKNLNALKELIQWQTVEYDQLFYSQKINSNVNVLVLSEGKSLLDVTCQVPIQANPTSDTKKAFNAVNDYLVERLLESLRRYISSLRDTDYEIDSSVQQQIQTDFVEMRRASAENRGPKISADDLHLFLSFARLLTLSYGQKTLTMEYWQKAKELELERRTRVMALK